MTTLILNKSDLHSLMVNKVCYRTIVLSSEGQTKRWMTTSLGEKYNQYIIGQRDTYQGKKTKQGKNADGGGLKCVCAKISVCTRAYSTRMYVYILSHIHIFQHIPWITHSYIHDIAYILVKF